MSEVAADSSPADPYVLVLRLDREALGSWLSGGHPAQLTLHLPELLDCEYSDYPWAALVVATALHDVQRGDQRVDQLINQAAEAFEQLQDQRGLAFVDHLRGNVALGHGRLQEATAFWEQARQKFAEASPSDEAIVGMIGLGAYQEGRLRDAIRFAEEALALARMRQNRRHEGIALLFLALFHVSLGECSRAAGVIRSAEDVMEHFIEPELQIELPMIRGARGTLEALRGNRIAADAAFSDGLDVAERLNLPWQQAIVRCLRAEMMAEWEPQRSLLDAELAHEALMAMNDAWWSGWALRAMGMASLEAGDLVAAQLTLSRLLDEYDLPPIERGRGITTLADAHLRAGQIDQAKSLLVEANQLYEEVAAHYWRAKALLLMAYADSAAGAIWHRRARQLADGDPSYDYLFAGRSALSIRLFTEPGIWIDGRKANFDTHNAEACIYLLVLAPGSVLNGETLVAELWGDCPPQKQSGRLRTLLWQVRKSLTPVHAWRLSYEDRVVRLELSHSQVDVLELRSAARALLRGELTAAEAKLRRDELLEALRQPFLPTFQHREWAIEESLRLSALAEQIADYY